MHGFFRWRQLAVACLPSQEASCELVIQVPEDLPTITADRDRIIQVLINLISNAVKFTERGTVEVGVTLQSKDSLEFPPTNPPQGRTDWF